MPGLHDLCFVISTIADDIIHKKWEAYWMAVPRCQIRTTGGRSITSEKDIFIGSKEAILIR